MNQSSLKEYEEKEREFARARCGKALRDGIIADPTQIFAEIPLPKTRALHRPGAPISTLCLLYPTTFVFIPATTQDRLEARFGGIPFADLMKLVEHGIIQPVIGDPNNYSDSNLNYLDPLLNLHPPSIWARGTEIIKDVGGPGYFEEAERLLPLDRIAQIDWVRERWEAQHPLFDEERLIKQIRHEVSTLYANLCAFGYHDYAFNKIAKEHNPRYLITLLLEANELLVYPKLMAAGGTSVYQSKDKLRISRAPNHMPVGSEIGAQRFVGEELDYLLSKLELAYPLQISVEGLVNFHSTSISRKLVDAVDAIEKHIAVPKEHAIENLREHSERFQQAVREALIAIEDFEKTRGTLKKSVPVGIFTVSGLTIGILAAVLTGGIGGLLMGVGGGAGVATISEKAGWSEDIVDGLIKHRFGPVVANLWRLKSN